MSSSWCQKNEEKWKRIFWFQEWRQPWNCKTQWEFCCYNWSNAYGVQPIGNGKRWIKGKGKQNIQQPAIIAAYNREMGGVDLFDHALSDWGLWILGKSGVGHLP